MARLKTVEISEELRTSLAAATFTGFTLAAIPTGRDPRRFDPDGDLFPQAVVHLKSTQTHGRGVGGGTEALHSLALFLVFTYADGDDINGLKLAHAAELLDWLCDHKSGSNYKLHGEGMPGWDYDPHEELVYEMAGANVAVIRLDATLRQVPLFAL